MSGFATAELATAVTRCGGLGYIGFTGSTHVLRIELDSAAQQLRDMPVADDSLEVLPIGVGIIVSGLSADPWLRLFAEYKPAVVWLSFGDTQEFVDWISRIHEASPNTKVWVQVGSVTTALGIAQSARPDALVLQGSDAGGHGHEIGASLVTLIPEVFDTLRDHDLSDIPLVAAGGIMDGRGAAAAIMLGAAGIVMGTRFLGAQECRVGSNIRGALFAAVDGGQATVRSRIFDEIWGPNPWPKIYDGRCLRNAMYDNFKSGMSIDDIQAHFLEHCRMIPQDVVNTSAIWAGTGVGMLKNLERASEIVEVIRTDAKRLLKNAAGLV
ncbi:hypothetical protein G7054_g3784 [Neopestalotiopsis clavispora]|nr:hypothetical protein G7054_g3784 [Neopestalotiopsis clavispora]